MKRIDFKIALILIFCLISINLYTSDVKKIKKRAIDSIVKVVASNHKEYITTGVAVDKNHLFTHLKIISAPYKELYIVTAKGDRYDASLKGIDRGNALLLLEINEKILKPFKYAKTVELGDNVLLLGGFYKTFPAIFKGIISSIDQHALVIDSSIVPGSIGGAVLNEDGEFLGIIRGRLGFTSPIVLKNKNLMHKIRKEATADLCLATPYHMIEYSFKSLKKFGKVKKSWLGISMGQDLKRGIEVVKVTPNSPAEKSGILAGDRITGYNNFKVTSQTQFSAFINTTLPDQTVELKILRNNQLETFKIPLEELKPSYISQSVNIQTFSSRENLPEFFTSFPDPIDLNSLNQFGFPFFTRVLNICSEIEINNQRLNQINRTYIINSSNFLKEEEVIQINQTLQKIKKDHQEYITRLREIILKVDNSFKARFKTVEVRLNSKGKPPKIMLIKKDED